MHPSAFQRRASVLLVEDDPLTRERIALAIAGESDLEVAGSAATAEQAREWLASCRPDVMLVDLGLPDGSGIEVIQECRRLHPTCEVMVITMFGDEQHMMQAFTAGANGYLLKDGREDDLAQHIKNLRNGGSPMSPIIARQLLKRLGGAVPEPAAERPEVELSPKEGEVLALVARGFSYPEVAQLMSVSVTTVRTHARNIYGKLCVKSKTEAVYEARQIGLLRP